MGYPSRNIQSGCPPSRTLGDVASGGNRNSRGPGHCRLPRDHEPRDDARPYLGGREGHARLVRGRARVRRCRRPLRGSYSYVEKQSCVTRRVLAAAARLCPPFGRAQISRLTRDNRLRTVVHTTRYVPHPSLCPRCAQHLARVYLRAFVGGQAIVRPDELCSNCQVRLQEFARCHRREVA